MTTTHTNLTKIGDVYATDDLAFYVRREAAGWRLRERATDVFWHLGRNKAEALDLAEQRIAERRAALLYKTTVERVQAEYTADDLPWEETLDLADAGLWHRDADACCCSVCGRDVPSQRHGVVLVGGGAIACKPEHAAAFEKYDGGAFLGVYPVGSECIKKIPAEYRYEFSSR